MKKTNLRLGGLAAAALILSACTAGASGTAPVTSVNVGAQSSLQFAVGTANIAGVATNMNVVSTFRQSNGFSAVLVDTPTLTGPMSFAGTTPVTAATNATITKGPSAAEAGTGGAAAPANCPSVPCITGNAQVAAGTPASALPYSSSFGTTGGAFGTGFAPANYTSGGVPNSYTPYKVPVYGPNANAFTPWGGPPAYDPNGSGKGTRDGTFPSQLLGVTEAINVFQGVTPGAGTYTLNVNVPGSTGTVNFTKTFTLAAPVVLPTIAAPAVTFDGTGGASIAYTLPPGIVGAYIQVVDLGVTDSGSGSQVSACASPAYYTFWVTSSGSSAVTNAQAPKGKTKAICGAADNAGTDSGTGAPYTGDNVQVNVVGFDYNHYALTYNGKLTSTYPQTPALPANADVSISAATVATSP